MESKEEQIKDLAEKHAREELGDEQYRQINGVTYPCPVPTSNKETFSFYVEGTESL
jgi:hypothetical protein